VVDMKMRAFDHGKHIDDHVVSHSFIRIMPECIVVTSHQTITKSQNSIRKRSNANISRDEPELSG
jgi:hypothetical protein